MKIDYSKILKKNMINVFKDVLIEIEKNGLREGHHLYITFNTKNSKVKIIKWLKQKYPNEMTIIIQYEYSGFKINKNSFNITLSFNDVKTKLEIPFDSVISFADPFANFGLKLTQSIKNYDKNESNNIKKSNIIEFKNYKKNDLLN